MKYGGIELCGTKIVYGICDESGLLERHSIPTTNPAATLTKIQEYFREKKIEKLGIATLGPVDISTGIITTTPKQGWSGVNLKEWFGEWEEVKKNINGHSAVPEIVLPELVDNAGVIGAIELGRRG